MRSKLNKIASTAIFMLAITFTTAAAQTWDGTANTDWYNPSATEFTITTAEQLAGLASLVNDGTETFENKTITLGNDIVLGGSAGANHWIAIGNSTNSFNGTFDGDGHTVSGVYINNESDFQGLFGVLYEGTIKNLGVVNSYIKGGNECVGGLVGISLGTVSNSYYTGTVTGIYAVGGLVGGNVGTISNSYAMGVVTGGNQVGGLVGQNVGTISNSYSTSTVTGIGAVGGLAGQNRGTVSNSYSTGAVTGEENVGGLVGYNSSRGTISNSYSIGAVTGNNNVGGLVGSNDYDDYDDSFGTVSYSYYDKTTSKQTDTGKGIGKTTAEMQSEEFVGLLNAWAGFLSMNAWIYSEGKYPELSDEPATQNYFAGGNGTEANPYVITTKGQLEILAYLVNTGNNLNGEYFKLGNDIALNGSEEDPWTAIGYYNRPNLYYFQGTFDGDGHVVSGVYINNESKAQGLFGYLYEGGTIKNLGVVNSYIKGKGGEGVGGLVGFNIGTVSNSYSTSTVTGIGAVGGLVGWNNGTISNSYSTGTVAGDGDVGGLVGRNNGTVINSYATGAVTGENYVGGLVGDNEGTVSNSYATGAVTGNEKVGGLVGYNGDEEDGFGTISNSYYDKTTSKQTDTGKGEGKTTAEMKLQTTYAGWDFENTWAINSTINKGYPYLLGVNVVEPNTDPDPEVYPLTVTNGTGSGNYTEGETVIISANLPPAGKRFKEWSITPAVTYLNGTNKTSEEAEFAMPAQAVTATAIYEDLPPTHHAIEITTNGNGIANPSATSAPQGTEITLTVTPNAGYRFKEWQIISGGISIVNNKFTMPNAAVEAKAIFELIPYTVTFNSQEGSAVAPQTINHGAKATAPTAPTREGYTFAGWFKEAAGTTLWDFATDVVTGDVTLFAKWEIDNTPIISHMATGGIIAQAIGRDIVLSNLPQNAKVEVFGLNGKRVYVGNSANSKILRILIQTKGVYVVKAGGQSLRVVVR